MLYNRPLIFKIKNYDRSNSLSLKYQRFTPSGCKDIGIRKFEFVAKTHFILRHEVDYPVKIRVLHNRFKMLVNIK